MSKPRPTSGDSPWLSLTASSPCATPSWIAPSFGLEPRPLAVTPTSTPPSDTAPTYAPPSIRVAPGHSAPPVIRSADSRPPPEYPDLREEVAQLRAQLDAQATVLAEVRRAILAASEADLVRLACVIAERIAGRELALDPTLFVTWARDAVDSLASGDDLCLALSPDLAALVNENAFRAAMAALGAIEVDSTLAYMTCEARTRVSRVTASLEARLGTVAEELGVPQE